MELEVPDERTEFVGAYQWPWDTTKEGNKEQLFGILAYFLDRKQLDSDWERADFKTKALKQHFLSKVVVQNSKGDPFGVSFVLLQKFFWVHLSSSTIQQLYQAYQAVIDQEWQGRWWYISVFLPSDQANVQELLDSFLENPNRDWLPFDGSDSDLIDKAERYQQSLNQQFPPILVQPENTQSVCFICREPVHQKAYCSAFCCDPQNLTACCRKDFQSLVAETTADVYRALYTGTKWSGPITSSFIRCAFCRPLSSSIQTRTQAGSQTVDIRQALEPPAVRQVGKRKKPETKPAVKGKEVKKQRPPPSKEDIESAQRLARFLGGF